MSKLKKCRTAGKNLLEAIQEIQDSHPGVAEFYLRRTIKLQRKKINELLK